MSIDVRSAIDLANIQVENLKADIELLKINNDKKINNLVKVHFDEMKDARSEIIKMRATIEEMKQLNTSIQELEETNRVTIFECDQCEKGFTNKNSLRSHINKKHGGNKHKMESEKMKKIEADNDSLRAEVGQVRDMLAQSEDIKDGLMNALQEKGKRSDTSCYNCDKEFYNPEILERHHELYQWRCISCGECLKTNDDECCDKNCPGTVVHK